MTQTRQKTPSKKLRKASAAIMMLSFWLAETSAAQPFYLPTAGLNSVSLENASPVTQSLWVAVPVSENSAFSEVEVQIPPHSTVRYDLREEHQYPWIQLKSYTNVPVKVTADSAQGKAQVVPGRSENLQSPLIQAKMSGTLILTNLSPISQEGIILSSSPRKRKGSQVSLNLPKFGEIKVALSVEKGDKIQIQAKYPIAASFHADNTLLLLRPVRSVQSFEIKPLGAYFEMINGSHDQSFIFYSEDPLVIDEARRQINEPAKRKILIAKVQQGHDNTNRDISSSLRTPWSWSVSQVYGFASIASHDCSGNPQLLEDFLVPWLIAEQNICFWGYKIQRELNPLDVQ
jgi:hypothetical protein